MSWLESAARWSVRLPRGALRAPALRMRQPARALADEPEQRQPGPGRERDVSPSKLRREAIICPPAIHTTWPYRLPPQIPPPRRPPSRPPPPPPRPTTRLDFVRNLRVPARCKPPPPRSPNDPPVITGLCPMEEVTNCPRVPGPGGQQPEPKPQCGPPSPPPPPPPPADTCCLPPGQDEASIPRPLFSCEPPLDCQGPCPPPPECPCPPPPPPPALLRFASAFFWWTGRAALGASLVYWTYVYGLWGSSDDTKAIVDQWRKAVGFTKQAGTGLWLGLSKLWDGGVKAVFSAIALGLQYMMGPGMGTNKPRHQTAEVAREPEPADDEDDELAPCGCCKRKSDAAERDLAG